MLKGEFMKRFKYDWLVYLLVSVLAIALGIVLIVNNYEIGLKILNIAIAIILVAYMLLFLLPILKHKRGTVQILVIVEFILIGIIAIGLILQQFKVFNIVGACKIIGLVIWLRCIVELFRAYFYRGKDSSYKYAVWYLCIILALFTLGVYMFAKPFFSDQQVVLALSIGLFVAAAVLIVLGIICLPKNGKKKSSSKKETAKQAK